jgi:HD-GYP domain-containing protein (c-di-GMP phosphodiesterase class II)
MTAPVRRWCTLALAAVAAVAILAVAGVFDALCSDRHYHSAMPLDKVFYILTADDQFDPEIIEALRVLVERGEKDPNRQTRNRP